MVMGILYHKLLNHTHSGNFIPFFDTLLTKHAIN